MWLKKRRARLFANGEGDREEFWAHASGSGPVSSDFPWVREQLADGGVLYSFPGPNQRERPALLLCHGFAQNSSAFTLPARSLVRHARAAGIAPYVLELPVRRSQPGASVQYEWDGLSRYANVVAVQAMDRVQREHDRVFWLGHSMGGLIGLCLPPGSKEHISALVSVGSPLLPAIPGGRLANRVLYRCARALAGADVPLPGKSIARKLDAWAWLLDHPVPGSVFPLQLWHPRSLQPAEIRYALREAFDDDTWSALADLLELGLSSGRRAGALDVEARLREWRAPAMVVAGDEDRLVPLHSARLLFDRLGATQKSFLEIGAQTTGAAAGHIDVLMGAHAEAHVWPQIIRFLQRHGSDAKAARITPQ